MASLSTNSGTKADAAFLAMGSEQIEGAIAYLCRTDFLVFQRIELGLEIGPQHHMWAEDLASGQDVIELAPRDHGKSVSCIQAYALWKAKYDPWVQEILILGADASLAIRNLDKIKELLDGSPFLVALRPEETRKSINSRSEIRLGNGKTIKAKGIGSPLRGRHPQLILLDDVLNERNSLDPDNRRTIRNYINGVVVPMKDRGLEHHRQKGYKSQLVIVGTAQHQDDFYHECLQNPSYRGRKLRAILDHEKKIVLWAERYSYEALMELRAQVGSLMFQKEYQNEPITDETSLFPTTLFDPLKDRNLSYAQSYDGPNNVYMGVDFSIPGSADGDWTVIAIVEVNPSTQTHTVLNYWRSKPQEMKEQIYQIELWCQLYKVTLGYLEDNSFQKLYSNQFRKNSALPLSGHTVTRQNKGHVDSGVLAFRPQFENFKWAFPYQTPEDQVKTDLIIAEFNGITQRNGKIGNESYHDDIVMALWHAASAARQGTAFSVSWD